MSTTITLKQRAHHQDVVDAIYKHINDVIMPKYSCIFTGIPVRYEMNDKDLGKYVYNISAFVPGFVFKDRFRALALQIFDYPDENKLRLRMTYRDYEMGNDTCYHTGVWDYNPNKSVTAFESREVTNDRHETGTLDQLIITPITPDSAAVLKKYMQVFEKHCDSLAYYYKRMCKVIESGARYEVERQFKCAERDYTP